MMNVHRLHALLASTNLPPSSISHVKILRTLFPSNGTAHFCSKPNTAGNSVDVCGHTYQRDHLTNITPAVLSKVDRNLHNLPGHPLGILCKRIESYFYKTYRRRGNPIYSVYNNLSPVVTLKQNFDSLLVPADHVSRRSSESYYVNSEYMLRAHTSAHQHDLVRSGLDAFIIAGDVYRRDAIDSTHYPVFHQLEIVRLFSDFELFSDVRKESSVSLFETGCRHNDKQERHSMETALMLRHDLKTCVEGLMQNLFGEDLQMRWVDAYFPFTHPSWELEIFHQGEWVEMLGSGVMEQKLLDSAGAHNKAGWAVGIGLERLAMKLFSIPDIRLFWSTDSGFLHQFQGRDIHDSITYKPVSKYPQCTNDISFWIPELYTANDFYDLVRSVGGEIIEQVNLIDEFVHPKTDRCSHCYRIVYRHLEKTLTQQEVNKIHQKIENLAESELGVEVR